MLGALGLSTQCAELERRSRIGAALDGVARVEAIEALYGSVARALGAEVAARDPY